MLMTAIGHLGIYYGEQPEPKQALSHSWTAELGRVQRKGDMHALVNTAAFDRQPGSQWPVRDVVSVYWLTEAELDLLWELDKDLRRLERAPVAERRAQLPLYGITDVQLGRLEYPGYAAGAYTVLPVGGHFEKAVNAVYAECYSEERRGAPPKTALIGR
jgi:hypothetical protein